MTDQKKSGDKAQRTASQGVYSTQVPQPGSPPPPAVNPSGARTSSVEQPSMAKVAGGSSRPFGTLLAPAPGTVAPSAEPGRSRPEPVIHPAVTHSYRDTDGISRTLNNLIGTQRIDAPFTESAPERFAGGQQPPQPHRQVGRSTWNLRIHQRAVAGQMSGIINEMQADARAAYGLQSALIAGMNSPEYEVLERLGAGNMGVVYRARQTSLNRDLAIKTLKPESLNPEHDQAMFVSEAVVTANLVHPNIVPIHDLGRTADGKIFYSMKHVTGMPWSSTLKARTLEENLDIFSKVCDAVAYAHSRGVINRDLKPENVMIGEFGEVIVLDWGLAITTEAFEKQDSVVVEFRGGTGSPVYMAPEMVLEDISGIGVHSDVYLLGAVLFEVLEGFPPHLIREAWHAEDPDDQLGIVLRAVLNNEIEERVIHTGELMQIARKAMETDPADRFPSVEHLQDAIREYRITGRADELLRTIEEQQPDDYDNYQSAVALYTEALRNWPTNRRAIDGNEKARVAYARLARRKGDYDLGLHIVSDRDNPVYRSVRSKLLKSRRVRKVIRLTWSVLLVAAVALTGVTLYQEQRVLHADQIVNAAIAEMKDAEETAQRVKIQAQKTVDDAEAEAKSRIDEADMRVAAANKREQEALAAEADALKTAKEAAMAEMQARADADRYRDDAEKFGAQAAAAQNLQNAAEAAAKMAQEQAMIATAQLESANKAKQEAQLSSYLRRIETSNALGEYGEVINKVNEALEELPFIDEATRTLLRKRRDTAVERQRNAQRRMIGVPAISAISADGSTMVVVSSGLQQQLDVWRRPEGSESIDDFQRHEVATVTGVRDLNVSADGELICAICTSGVDPRRVWQWSGDGFTAVAVGGERPLSGLRRCLLSTTGEHLYFIGSDREGTVEIHAVEETATRQILTGTLWARGNFGLGVLDAVVLPDESAIIVEPASDYFVTAFPINWTDGKPELGLVSINAPTLKGLTDARFNSARFQPVGLAVSPSGDELALISDRNEILVLPRNPAAKPEEFPFRSPLDLTDLNRIQSAMLVTRVVFSPDGQRMATLHGKPYMQVWDKVNGRFEASEVDGLYPLRNQPGSLLRGHSQEVLAVSFAGASGSDLLSVGADQEMRTWDLDTYGEYVKQLQDLCDAIMTLEPGTDRRVSVSDRSHTRREARVTLPQQMLSRRYQFAVAQPPGVSAADRDPPGVPPAPLVLASRTAADPISLEQGRNIFSAQFSSDGDRLLIGSDDLAAHVFDSRSGGRTMSMSGRLELFFEPNRNNFLEGHVSEIAAIRFLPPKGDLLLTSDYFGSISVWDAVTDDDGIGYEKSRLLSEYSFSEFAVSDDGQWIMAAGAVSEQTDTLDEAKLRHLGLLWRVSEIRQAVTARPAMVLEGQHPDFAITAVAVSPDSSRVVTAGRRGRMVLWDRESGEVVAAVDGAHNSDGVSGVFFTNDGELISSGFDGQVLRWSVEGNRLAMQQVLVDGQFMVRMRPSPDRTRFTVSDIQPPEPGSPDSVRARLMVDLYSVSGESLRPIISEQILVTDPERAVRHDVSWSFDGQRLLLTMDGVLTLYDTNQWKVLKRYRLDQADLKATRGALAPTVTNDAGVAATFDGRFAHLWSLEDGSHIAEFRTHANRTMASFSSDRKYVVTASETIRIFESDEAARNHGQTLLRMRTGDAHARPLASVAFSPKEGDYRFGSADRSGNVRLWDWSPDSPATASLIAQIDPPDATHPTWGEDMSFGNSVTWRSDAAVIATVQQGEIRMWRLAENGPQEVALPVPPETEFRINEAVFSRSQPLLVAGGVAYSAETGRLTSLALIWRVEDQGAPRLVAMAAGGHSTIARSREQETGVTTAAIDDAADELLTGGADGRLIRWQLGDSGDETVYPLQQIVQKLLPGDIAPHERSITGLDVAADGRVVSTDEQGRIHIWPAIGL